VSESADGGEGESCDPGDASVLGCVGCKITCEGLLDERTLHCYFAAGADDAFASALQRCLALNAHVVTLGSGREAELVDTLVADAGYWVGLARSSGLGAYVAAAPGEPGYPIVGSSGPCLGCFERGSDGGVFPALRDGGESTECVVSIGGRWSGVPCASSAAPVERFETVCEREPPGLRLENCGGVPCLSLPVTRTTKSYLLFSQPMTAEDAEQSCGALGARLVTFETREERESLARELEKLLREPRLTAWIGLRRTDGGFVWDDGVPDGADGGPTSGTATPVRPPPWGDREPRADAGARAFLTIRDQVYDSQLVRTADEIAEPARRAFVCEKAR